jgi:hypothetical protein
MQFVLCVEGEVTPHMPRLHSADWRPFVKLPKSCPLKDFSRKQPTEKHEIARELF